MNIEKNDKQSKGKNIAKTISGLIAPSYYYFCIIHIISDIIHHMVLYEYNLIYTVNATLFFLSSFQSVNNLKSFVSGYHLNDPTMFLQYLIHVLVHMCYKCMG